MSEAVRGFRGRGCSRPRVRGFNAIFATASIDAARRYYTQFQLQQAELPEDAAQGRARSTQLRCERSGRRWILDDEAFDTDALSTDARDFLEDAIQDYNDMFGTSYDTQRDRFQNYYKDLSQRMKNREIDLVIVVNMFLTGFDATTLNTLFVDKNLRSHGLIQAYSRTNRILNSVKTYGNIVSFREPRRRDERGAGAFRQQGGPWCGSAQAVSASTTLTTRRRSSRCCSSSRSDSRSSAKPRRRSSSSCSARSSGCRTSSPRSTTSPARIRSPNARTRTIGASTSTSTQSSGRVEAADKEAINDDVVFEIELIKQVEINVDYILMLVEKYRASFGDGEDKEIRAQISRAVDSSPTLRNKRDLVEDFVDSISMDGAVDEQWQQFVAAKREAELEAMIAEQNLRPEQTRAFIESAFRDGRLSTAGTAITAILPPGSRFAPEGGHGEKKKRAVEGLTRFFERFFGLGTGAEAVRE